MCLVSILIPCRNEEGHIASCLDCVLAFSSPGRGFEVLVVDGLSEDNTRGIVQEYCRHDPRVRLLTNPQKTVPHAMNIGIRAARGKYIARLDAHSEYDRDYLVRCLETIERTGADNVGGPWVAAGHTKVQRAIAVAFSSPFTIGNARSHYPHYEGPVDSVFPGFYKRDTLLRLGLYDEELVRNQDDELNLRLIRSGGTIYQSPKIRLKYFPRSSLKALFLQYMQYGYWKVRVMQKHRLVPSWRHLVPGAFVVGLALGPLFRVLSPTLFALWFFVLGLYGLASVGFSLRLARKHGWDLFPLLPAVFFTYHTAYGLGFLNGVLDFFLLRKHPSHGVRARYAQLTR